MEARIDDIHGKRLELVPGNVIARLHGKDQRRR